MLSVSCWKDIKGPPGMLLFSSGFRNLAKWIFFPLLSSKYWSTISFLLAGPPASPTWAYVGVYHIQNRVFIVFPTPPSTYKIWQYKVRVIERLFELPPLGPIVMASQWEEVSFLSWTMWRSVYSRQINRSKVQTHLYPMWTLHYVLHPTCCVHVILLLPLDPDLL
jgi:hypothetical protein